MLYLGRSYRVELVDTQSGQIEFAQRFFVPRTLSNGAQEGFRQWYKQRAEERLIPRAGEWAKRLGVEPRAVSIADVRYRWGSCTKAGAIRLNWRLIKAPTLVADYVIVHELAHPLQGDHGERFWSIVYSQIPKAEACRAWLRDQGGLLEQEL